MLPQQGFGCEHLAECGSMVKELHQKSAVAVA